MSISINLTDYKIKKYVLSEDKKTSKKDLQCLIVCLIIFGQ